MANQTIGLPLFLGKPDVLGVATKAPPTGRSSPPGETFLDVLQDLMPFRPVTSALNPLVVLKTDASAAIPVLETSLFSLKTEKPVLPLSIKSLEEQKAEKDSKDSSEKTSSTEPATETTLLAALTANSQVPEPVQLVLIPTDTASTTQNDGTVKETPAQAQSPPAIPSLAIRVSAEETTSLPQQSPDPTRITGKVEQTPAEKPDKESRSLQGTDPNAQTPKREIPKILLDLFQKEAPVAKEPATVSAPVIPQNETILKDTLESPPAVKPEVSTAQKAGAASSQQKSSGVDTSILTDALRGAKVEKMVLPGPPKSPPGGGPAKADTSPSRAEPVELIVQQPEAKPDGTTVIAALPVPDRSQSPVPLSRAGEVPEKTVPTKDGGEPAETLSPSQGTSSKHVQPDTEPSDMMSGRNSNSTPSHQQATTRAEIAATKEPIAGQMSSARELPAELSRSVVDQVVKEMAIQIHGASSEVRITLQPESLGEVTLKVQMQDGKMQAQIDVTQSSVKAAIESNMPQLRQALQDRGIEVHRIDVFVPEQSLSKESGGRQGDKPKRQGGRAYAGLESVGQYQSAKMLGYNTMDIIM